jgi:hypothetical protein
MMTDSANLPRKGGGAVLVGSVGRLLVRWCISRSMLRWLLEPGREDDDIVSITSHSIRIEVSGHQDDAAAKSAATDVVDKLALAATQARGAV